MQKLPGLEQVKYVEGSKIGAGKINGQYHRWLAGFICLVMADKDGSFRLHPCGR